MAMVAKSLPTEAFRPLVNFPPSPWSAEYLVSLCPTDSELRFYTKRVEELKPQVKAMLMNSTNDVVEKVKLIDLICRLGISYHFENEIEDQLAQIFNSKAIDVSEQHDHDLYTAGIIFRVFRGHGYKISCELFNKFKGDDGNFKTSLTTDVKGLLSLYEAAHLSVHGEDILDEAIDYTTTHLKSLESHCSPRMAKRIAHALHQPLHKGIQRLEAREYISSYEEEDEEEEQEQESRHYDVLIKFAKLDFNGLQLLHRRELSDFSRWFIDTGIPSVCYYARQRIVEIYLWAMSTMFEPQYARIRVILAKVTILMSILDDTYDAYGTIEELRRFTDAIQRWEIGAIDELPEYMKPIYKVLLSNYLELESYFENEDGLYWVSYAKDTMKQMVRCYHLEVEWCNKNYVPSYDEYMETAAITSGYHAMSIIPFIGMGQNEGIETFEWFKSFPKIDRATCVICRLMDDIVTADAEKARSTKQVSTSIEIYMRENNIESSEEAIRQLKKKILDAWKDINEECMRPTAVSMHLLASFTNLSRVMDVYYKHKDGYTNSVNLKEYIKSAFIDAIPIEE